MNQITQTLQNIAQTANAAQETVLNISFYPGSSYNAYVYRLYILLEEVKNNSTKSIGELSYQIDKKKLKGSLHTIYESMSSAEEMHTMLKRTMPETVPEYLRTLLENYINNLKSLLVQLAPQVEQLYGRRESLFIVTPGYQSLAGLW